MKKKLLSLVMAAAMVLGLTACGSSADTADTGSDDSASGTTFKIGTIGPLTGDAAIYGQAVANGAKIAVDEINASDSAIKFELQSQDDVADGEVRKMLFRHPHVFGGQETVQDADTVLEGWEAIKRREKGQQTTAQALDAVARSLPGLWRAEKLQSKAARDGFDWPDISGALDKLDEEVSELRRAAAGDGDVTEELGDVLFAAVKVGRFAGVDPEVAIHGTCEKFIRRYRAVEEGAAAMGRSVDQLPLETLEALWVEAKRS